MRNKKRRSLLLPLLASVLIMGAGVELGVRRWVPLDALVYRDSDDPFLRFELRPGAAGLKGGVEVSINSAGQRGPEPAPKAAGATRVAFIGGHETFGFGVELADAYPGRAADGASKDRKAPVEPVNLSMYSYTLGQKVRLACSRLAGLDADLAVLQVSDEDHRELPLPGVDAPALKNFLRERSAAFRLLIERRYWRRVAAEEAALNAGSPGVPMSLDAMREEQSRIVGEQLAAFKRCLEAAGATGAIVLVPNLSVPLERVTPKTAAFRAALKSQAHSLGFEFQDAGPALRRLPPTEALQRYNEPVLSPNGQRVLGESVRALLKRLKPRPRPAGRPSA